ncbi:unnamed protein product [Spirodela intermedia]|uniref:Uncharacterized protein n=1 Tax=Spirodela intermedia TaxID=51605 RepID=A0ABN7E9U7_SPIIN|nr:unnamed protein product [Spirodela intermedia]
MSSLSKESLRGPWTLHDDPPECLEFWCIADASPGFFSGWVHTLMGYSTQGKYYSEVIVDIAPCPMEAVKVLYKGLGPLWDTRYLHAIPTPKDKCNKSLQLSMSFVGDYVFIISHPADNLVSFINMPKELLLAVKKLGLWGLFTRRLPLCIVIIPSKHPHRCSVGNHDGWPATGGVAPGPAAAASAPAA